MPAPPSSTTTYASPALHLSRNEAQARTTIAQRAAGLPVSIGQTQWQTRITPLVYTPDCGAADLYSLRLEWAGAVFTLRVPASAAQQLVSANLNGASLPHLPPELASAAVQACMHTLLQSLQGLGRGAPALMQFTSAHADDAALPTHAFALQLQAMHGDQAIACQLHTDGLGLLLIAGLLTSRPPVAAQTLPHVPLTLHANIGFTHLPADTLAQLGEGDVVLMDACFIRANRVLWLSADGYAGLHAQLAPVLEEDIAAAPHLTIIQPWSQHMPADTEILTTPTEETGSSSSLSTLPVRLSFDLGDVQLTLAQVQSLQTGQTINLARPLAGAVRIRANGALIGEGDLLEIDGQIGVSVAHIFGGSN